MKKTLIVVSAVVNRLYSHLLSALQDLLPRYLLCS
jgi:hypothetical protein